MTQAAINRYYVIMCDAETSGGEGLAGCGAAGGSKYVMASSTVITVSGFQFAEEVWEN